MISNPEALDTWKQAMRFINETGYDFLDTYNRVCREVNSLVTQITIPESIFKPILLLSTIKKWSYPPLEEIEALIFAKKAKGFYDYSYGDRIFNYEGINQIEQYIIPLLRKEPETRRASLGLWNPRSDCDIDVRSLPSVLFFQFTIKENRVNIAVVIRSNDMLFGYPANLYQAFLLQQYIAHKLDKEQGNITIHSLSAHIFRDYLEDMFNILGD